MCFAERRCAHNERCIFWQIRLLSLSPRLVSERELANLGSKTCSGIRQVQQIISQATQCLKKSPAVARRQLSYTLCAFPPEHIFWFSSLSYWWRCFSPTVSALDFWTNGFSNSLARLRLPSRFRFRFCSWSFLCNPNPVSISLQLKTVCTRAHVL